MTLRIGHGYDAHRLVPDRKLIIGGVEIPYEKGLLGHSDADVLTHAVIDAVLGALALGDIGSHFPDSDERYKGADSLRLLAKCVEIIGDKGYTLGNLDATIIAQKPRMAAYIGAMRDNLAAVFGCQRERISVKAKTEEGMGFTGTGDGISAHCVCVVAAALRGS